MVEDLKLYIQGLIHISIWTIVEHFAFIESIESCLDEFTLGSGYGDLEKSYFRIL